MFPSNFASKFTFANSIIFNYASLGLGAAWFGAAFTFLIFYKLFNYFNILMEALLALARPYGQTRTVGTFLLEVFNRGKTYLVPSILTIKFLNSFLINLQFFNFMRSRTGWLSGSFLVLGSLCCSQSSFLFSTSFFMLLCA